MYLAMKEWYDKSRVGRKNTKLRVNKMVLAAHCHDFHESDMGDIMYDVKRLSPVLKEEIKKSEHLWEDKIGLKEVMDLTSKELEWLHACDMIELLIRMSEEMENGNKDSHVVETWKAAYVRSICLVQRLHSNFLSEVIKNCSLSVNGSMDSLERIILSGQLGYDYPIKKVWNSSYFLTTGRNTWEVFCDKITYLSPYDTLKVPHFIEKNLKLLDGLDKLAFAILFENIHNPTKLSAYCRTFSQEDHLIEDVSNPIHINF
jgi:hypothetical protein